MFDMPQNPTKQPTTTTTATHRRLYHNLPNGFMGVALS